MRSENERQQAVVASTCISLRCIWFSYIIHIYSIHNYIYIYLFIFIFVLIFMYSLYFITFQRSGTRPVTKPLRSIRPEQRGTFHTQFWLIAIYIYIQYYIHTVYIYIHAHPRHQGLPISLTVSLWGQPFATAICQKKQTKKTQTPKNRKEKNNALESLLPFPHTKVGLPKLCFFCLSFLGVSSLVPFPFQNPTQNKSSKMCVCLFFLVWGRGGELRI